jgi:hypothetical protein
MTEPGFAGLVVLSPATVTPLAKADFSPQIQRCISAEVHPDIRIVACTWNIQSGRFVGPNVAEAIHR